MHCILFYLIYISAIYFVSGQRCKVACPSGNNEMVCGFNTRGITYKMFPSQCAMTGYSKCYDVEFIRTPLKFCLKNHLVTRRMYGESCPVFCPSHYRPVCAASKLRSYIYRSFNNGCYLDMVNCRGDDDFSGYVEVPLEFCQKHEMKNIFKEQVVVTNLHDYNDY